MITEQTSSQVRADTTTRREASISNSIGSLFGLQNKLLQKYPNIGGELAMTTNSENAFRGDGNTSRVGMLDGIVTCKVVDVHPNGNLVVFARQEIKVNFELREVMVTGIIRPEDIDSANSISHEQIAEMRVAYGGRGTLSDLQQPRYGTQMIDIIFPF